MGKNIKKISKNLGENKNPFLFLCYRCGNEYIIKLKRDRDNLEKIISFCPFCGNKNFHTEKKWEKYVPSIDVVKNFMNQKNFGQENI